MFSRLKFPPYLIPVFAVLMVVAISASFATPAHAAVCPAGSYYSGFLTCSLAQPGWYAPGNDAEYRCPVGKYTSGYGWTSCLPAPAGRYVSSTGASSYSPCSPGTYQPGIGQSSCLQTPAGYYSVYGYISPVACPVGTFQPFPGSWECNSAPPGSYVNITAATTSTPCAAGTYQPDSGQTSCIVAPAGTYVSSIGSPSYTPCPAGTTSDVGATECFPINTPPTADAGGPYSGDEGSAIAMSGATATDPDTADTLTYAWSVDSPLCSFGDASVLNPNLTCADNGSYTATLSVSDGVNPAVTSDASVTVNNVTPTLGAISVDQTVVPVNTAINASADFTDPGTNDTHTAAWDWGDSNSLAGTVTENAGSGSVSDSHSYSAAGVYTVSLTVTDKDGGVSNEAIYQYVVVYDPSAGFVTGGGWIDSPAGAYTANPSLTGKATFGFVSKYQKGASVPTGNTEFQFQAGDLNFHSDTYDWLVVNQSGTNAQFKGSGTVNGALDLNGNPYKFMLWAGDSSPDTFRIKIWSEDASGAETVVYDNGFDQAIGGGSIVVHN